MFPVLNKSPAYISLFYSQVRKVTLISFSPGRESEVAFEESVTEQEMMHEQMEEEVKSNEQPVDQVNSGVPNL